ncbi:23S rRNA (pseudouridine(1915)-N(3))-methyltransferase RlmH [uncultured Ruminococcus sp.]|uniref:23S rRNA (pseudouridine(1915)-N(3))-methyltransferase RlmH n=1 Tax=uncultured Ruminococcus sp. TaxID=165186 RepID=UPI0025EF3035|nr:23S rRNA (pseudouridine(1915)-N(3))-methyltransferase RlmH [uncultured Ruminococcus sp.]
MIRVNIICIGKIKEKYFTDAINEYAKRLSAFCKFSVVELSEEKIKSNNPNESQISEVINAEGRRILQKINQSDYVVAMCIEGKMLSSEELSKTIDNVSISGKSTLDFIIGGSYGLSAEVKQRADFRLSMSRMTFPHQMARMILSEQIYRAFEISSNGKYHK